VVQVVVALLDLLAMERQEAIREATTTPLVEEAEETAEARQAVPT